MKDEKNTTGNAEWALRYEGRETQEVMGLGVVKDEE